MSSISTALSGGWAKPPGPKFESEGAWGAVGPKSQKWAKAPAAKGKKCAILDLGLG